jgi:hypothetical protein
MLQSRIFPGLRAENTRKSEDRIEPGLVQPAGALKGRAVTLS